jgi:ADP-ribose pyrophosphatase YjhB (NUDIX family)
MNHIFATYEWKKSLPEWFKYCPKCGQALYVQTIDGMARAKCSACGYIQYRNPSPAVGVLALQDGKVALIKRGAAPQSGKWALPSGYVEYDEDFITAAVREMGDETGLIVEVTHVLHVESAFISPEMHFLTIYLFGHVVGGELRPGDDSLEAAWFTAPNELPELAFPTDGELIEKVMQQGFRGLPIL